MALSGAERQRRYLARVRGSVSAGSELARLEARLLALEGEVADLRARIERGKKLPPDWHPDEGAYEAGRLRGYDRSGVEGLADEMRDWAVANANRAVARKADWGRTFLGWIRKAPVAGPVAPKAISQAEKDSVRARAIKELARLREQEAMNGQGSKRSESS